MEIDQDKATKDAYFMNPEMIRFLLVENLALKTLLHEKGLIDPEQYKAYQQQAAQMLDAKMTSQLEEWKKANPERVGLLEAFAKLRAVSPDQRPDCSQSQSEDSPADASVST